MQEYFAVDRSPGLAEALIDESILTEEETMETSIDDLSVLTAGGEIPNPSEMLGSERMGHLLGRLEDAFDLVIVDTPPLLFFSDPVSVVPHTDGALVVVEANRADRSAVGQALSLLDDVDSPALGTVLNQFDPGRAGSYGYGYGSYGYGYGYQVGDKSLQAYYEEDEDDQSTGLFSFL